MAKEEDRKKAYGRRRERRYGGGYIEAEEIWTRRGRNDIGQYRGGGKRKYVCMEEGIWRLRSPRQR
jgi:hypothetical protein